MRNGEFGGAHRMVAAIEKNWDSIKTYKIKYEHLFEKY